MRELVVGFVGDSRGVLGRARAPRGGVPPPQLMAVPVTRDHKPTDPSERLRLVKCKAIVRPSRVTHPLTGALVEVGCQRVWDQAQAYGVAMTRALGDTAVHPYLVPIPEVSIRRLDARDRLLILASDGVWDVMDNAEAVQLASSMVHGSGLSTDLAAKEIVRSCCARWDRQMPGRRDDVTCTVLDLAHPDAQLEPEI